MTARLPAVSYQVSVHDLNAHLFEVRLAVAQPAATQVVSLPVWIPGSYMVREFSKHLQGLSASQRNKSLEITQLDKCTWQIHCQAGKPLVLTYQVYAFDSSVRTAWLDSQRGFFNGTSLCLRVHGLEEMAHELVLDDAGLPKAWQAVTALVAGKVNKRGFGSYLAANYDELVDSPVELGPFWRGEFVALGVTHQFVVSGAPPGFDGARLLADTQTICETEIRFWHGQHTQLAPHRNYLFMLAAVADGYGGLEHRHSTALICKRTDLPRLGQANTSPLTEGYTTLLGLISHEYFHTWNVKRLRPSEFTRYDYARENYTELLWFFEGFTSYYDDLLLLRAGLIDNTHYLKLLSKSVNQIVQTPGAKVQSTAQASFDAWVKYYRQDENTPNATVSYYTKGALVGLCLDLSLRHHNRTCLDTVMRALWQRCAGGPMTEDDVLTVVTDLAGPALAKKLTHWVHGTDDLPLKQLLQHHGIRYDKESASRSDHLGLKLVEQKGLRVKAVLRASPAEDAGFASGDEWLGVEVDAGKSRQAWRLMRLDDLALYVGDARTCQALIARDHRLLTLTLKIPAASDQVKLAISDPQRADAWLGGEL
jgi:predicted metalloprotease with PDZ domain